MLPTEWPHTTIVNDDHVDQLYDSAFTCKSGESKFTVSVIGGGSFNLKENGINLRVYGRSGGIVFDPLSEPYQDKLSGLLQLLVQKPAYNGFQVNFG
ncbi:MAG: hypothetical protein IH934_05690 [Nanoarchaeota archaeon]|nr:hypothetical protein [Nanoarchaeota archaeon]